MRKQFWGIATGALCVGIAGCAADVPADDGWEESYEDVGEWDETSDALTNLTGCYSQGSPSGSSGTSTIFTVPQTRGTVAGTAVSSTGTQDVTQTFTYNGITNPVVELGSGIIREQIGLKLRAQDACNLLYVMWRVQDRQVAVQIKRNPGQSTSSQCGNNGYSAVRYVSTNVPVMTVGSTHTLRARVSNQTLRVEINGLLVWEGSLVTAATPVGTDFGGVYGWRSDNVRARMSLTNVSQYSTGCTGD